jgi:hypothetical protein
MTVFLLLKNYDYEGFRILGLYSTPDLARQQLPTATWSMTEGRPLDGRTVAGCYHDGHDYDIEAWTIDEPATEALQPSASRP